ncbi:hypothetical protein TPA0907_54980 [Micromonospora humidisoli]|uniref:Restriction endonuclease subunit S n=1 Tax=Micromonospora humidisoli TaxID=2807622 RepID=A0ABS2J8Z9_9ACTN|nr:MULTISPECIES: restriction endonuclease subunit S [Micromonospora]MBM7083032.1 restriction endonuclease subunit S [Micromonospora humidisoli]GHJ11131.1 hypothetical protein TPA0907_54980 [Micromonospora sp. AKA109]
MSEQRSVMLGEVSSIQSGVGFPTRLQGRTRGRYPFAKVGDISRLVRQGRVELGRADNYVDESDLTSLRARPLPVGAVVFAKIGEAIRQNFRAITGVECLVDNNVMGVVPKADVLDPKYLYHFLRSVDLYPLATSTTVPSIRKSTLERIPVPLPPLARQRRIAEVLDRADELRVKRRESTTQLDELTSAIFLELFGPPDTNPRGWPMTRLADVLTAPLRNGISPATRGETEGQVLTLSSITGRRFEPTARKTAKFLAPHSPAQVVHPSDFLMCRGNGNLGLVGRGFFPSTAMPDTAFPDTIIAARVDTGLVRPAFLEHVWQSPAVRRQIESTAHTTNGTYKVNQKGLGGIAFFSPPLELQDRFTARIAAVDALRAGQSAGLAELDALFASLQNQAFRGSP